MRWMLPIFALALFGCPVQVNMDVTLLDLSQAGDIVDLTHELAPGIPHFPGGRGFEMENLAGYDKGYYANAFRMGEHTGTHVDAPGHFIQGARSVSEIPVRRLLTQLVVVDVRAKVKDNADYRVTADDILEWERTHGAIPTNAVVAIRTGWGKRWKDPKAYVNKDDKGVPHFPGLGDDAAGVLKERLVAGVAIDTLSVDYGPSSTFSVHKLLHQEGIYHIENVANLDRVPVRGALIVVGPLRIREGSGAPARVLAILPARK